MNIESLREYFVKTLGWGWGHQQQIVFSFLCSAAVESKGGVVLDAGAGHQRYKPFFCDSLYVAQEHPEAGKVNKKLLEYDILSDVRRIPLRDESVDLIISTSTVEHLEYPVEFFAESFRVLKPGGALYVNVPFVYPEHEIPFDFQRPTRYGLCRYYQHSGFDKVSVKPTSSSVYTAQAFFLQAVNEAGRSGRQSLWFRVIAGITRRIARLACWAAMRVFDREPDEGTSFPVGWVAQGYKPGEKGAAGAYDTVRQFLESSAECGPNEYLENGRILSRG